MSLTLFLTEPEVRKLFADSFKKPKIKITCEIKVPPITTKYSLVGTAFDYLLRFHLKYHNPNAITRRWVADGACESIKIHEPDDVYIGAKNQLDFAMDSYQRFLDDGILTDDLIRSSLILAHLDTYIRGGRSAYYKPVQIESEDIEDLKNLINVVDFDMFKAESHCILNPTFNGASMLVGGADADLVIDNKLIDIKTTINVSVTRDMFNQVVGYYLLGRRDGIGVEKIDGSTIDKIGFYFSRYGILHLYDVNDIIDSETLPDIMNQLVIMAKEKFRPMPLTTLPEVIKKSDTIAEEQVEPLTKSDKKRSIFTRIFKKVRMMVSRFHR